MSRLGMDPRRGAGPFYLVFQILGVDSGGPQPRLDAFSVRAVDDRGGAYKFEELIPDSGKPVPMDGGVGCIVPMRTPDRVARMFRKVEGEVLLDSGIRRRFEIRNLALPVMRASRVFGRLVPRKLSSEQEEVRPDEILVFREAVAESEIAKSEPVGEGPLSHPQRLILSAGEWTPLAVPSPL